MSSFNSDTKEQVGALAQDRVPLSGANLDAAIAAMQAPGFLEKLTARIMKLAIAKGFLHPFRGNIDLPGGGSAGDLAVDIVEKSLSGTYTWDAEKEPDFLMFCFSRAESILSNWLAKMRRIKTFSPVAGEDEEDDQGNPLLKASDPVNLYEVLRFKDGGVLGNKLLEDFALDLPDGSPEQKIIMTVFDDRDCATRSHCIHSLGLSESDYDAAVKRIKRAIPKFFDNWCKVNNVNPLDRKEIR